MRRRQVLALFASAVGASCGDRLWVGPGATDSPANGTGLPESLAEIVRSRRIRVAFNHTSLEFVAQQGASLTGIAWDVAVALSRDLGVSVDPVHFSGVQAGWDAGQRGDWDIWLTWRDVSQGFAFTSPVVLMQWAYLLPAGSNVRAVTELDRPGIRIAVPGRGPLVEYLLGTLAHAGMQQTSGPDEQRRLLEGRYVDAVGTSRQVAESMAASFPGGRVVIDPVLLSAHAIAVAARRTDLLTWATGWVEAAKRSGLVASIVARSGVSGIMAAPAGP